MVARHLREARARKARARKALPPALPAAVAALVLVLHACSPAARDEAETVLLPVPDDPTVTFAVSFSVGSQDDPPGKEGLAELTGALISNGGTEARSYDEILEELYPIASSYAARVDKEMTTLTGRTHVDNVDLFLELFSDAVTRPAFKEEDFKRLKSNQASFLENTLRYSSDEELAKAALTELIFEGTPYRHPVEGTVAGVDSITLADVRSFYETHYTRANATPALGGGYSAEILSRFGSALDQLAPGEPSADPEVTPAPIRGRHALLVSKPDADASISFGFPISVGRGDRDHYALWIATSWLGEHRSSVGRLYNFIRETRGLNYGDYAYVEAYPEGGQRQFPPPNVAREHQIFEIWIRTLPDEQAVFALRAALGELEDLVEDGMTAQELELSKTFLSKYYLHYAETTRMRLGYAIDDRFYGISGEGFLGEFRETITSLSLEEVNAALKRHLHPENVKIAIVTGEAEKLAEVLESDAPSPITYPTPKPDQVLEEDKAIERYPLGIASVRTVPVDEIFGR